MKVYRLKHIPTGLYFKGVGRTGCNLTPLGQLYTSKPSMRWVRNIRVNYRTSGKQNETDKKMADFFRLTPRTGWQRINRRIDTPETDWEIVEVEM